MPGVGSSSIFGLLAQSIDLEPTGEDCRVHYQPLEPSPTAERVTFSITFNHSNILIQIKSHSRSQVTDPKWQLLCRLNFNLGNTGTLEISIKVYCAGTADLSYWKAAAGLAVGSWPDLEATELGHSLCLSPVENST